MVSQKKYAVFIVVFTLILSTQAFAKRALVCTVEGSLDDFKIYSDQLVYASDQFEYYQLIEGLTVLIVNKKTLRFNRLSNLNILEQSTLDHNQPPEKHQFFSGTCQYANE